MEVREELEIEVLSRGIKRKLERESTELTNEDYERLFRLEIDKYKKYFELQRKKGYEMFKRTIDILFSIVALIPATILIVLLSIIIRMESEGSPIFTQVRVGKNGKLIKIHKMRSMRKDAEIDGQKWAEDDDPRITKVGKVLRKFRLDEIPQFFDVLSGNLSLIGPRPEVPSLTKQFNEETPGFVTRLLVTPGISGYAQVHGGYNIDYKEKWEKDNYYIENRNIKLYFEIFLKTIGVVFSGEDAK